MLQQTNRGLGFGRLKLVNEIIKANYNTDPTLKLYNYKEVLYIIQELLYEEGKYYQQGINYQDISKYLIFKEFIKYLLYRNLANYDSMLLISALKGAGKSSAAIMIAKEWCKLLGIRFDPKRHIAYNNADMMNKIEQLNKWEPLIADEAVRFACLCGSTIIKTANGNIPIKELQNQKNIKVYSFNMEKNIEEIQNSDICIKTKIDDIYELETITGEKIKCTKEHNFLTLNGWKKLSELKEGDEIFGI